MLYLTSWPQLFAELHQQALDYRVAVHNMFDFLKDRTLSWMRIELDASLLGTAPAVAELVEFTLSLLQSEINNLMFFSFVECVVNSKFEEEFMGPYLIEI